MCYTLWEEQIVMTNSSATTTGTSTDVLATTSASEFSARHLVDLLKGDCHAVRIPEFLSGAELDGLRERFVGRTDHGPLGTDGQFRRIGYAFSETTSADERTAYFDAARPNIGKLRDIAGPYAYPSDKLRLLLDETWPAGAGLLRDGNRPFFVGVTRYQAGGVDLEPHTDNVARNLPQDFPVTILRQLSVNVYLDMPDVGGELQIWPEYPDEADYQSRSGDRLYGLDRSSVGDPGLVVTPRVGDAIFIDPRRVHAVGPSRDRPRITVGMFVGVPEGDAPLAVWS